MHTLSTKSLEGNLETLILALLEQNDSYGYALNEDLREQSQQAISLKEGTLYPLLHRMEKKHWIQSYWQKPQGKRQRKYYRMTPAGARLLNERRKEWEQLKRIYRNLVETSASPPKIKNPPTQKPSKTNGPPTPSSVMDDDPLPDWLL